jgi:hypothetical protein
MAVDEPTVEVAPDGQPIVVGTAGSDDSDVQSPSEEEGENGDKKGKEDKTASDESKMAVEAAGEVVAEVVGDSNAENAPKTYTKYKWWLSKTEKHYFLQHHAKVIFTITT